MRIVVEGDVDDLLGTQKGGTCEVTGTVDELRKLANNPMIMLGIANAPDAVAMQLFGLRNGLAAAQGGEYPIGSGRFTVTVRS